MMQEIGAFLAEGGVYTVIGFSSIGGGLALLAAWHVTRPEDGRTGVHRDPVRSETDEFPTFRPAPRHASPLLARDTGHTAKRRLEGEPDEGTRRLWPTATGARARVVLIGPEGILDDEEASRAYRARTEGRVRRAPGAGTHEEVGRPDRERGELAREAVEDGEEGGAHTEGEGTAVASARWFRNAVTGEYIFVDEYGRKVDFEA